MKSGPKNLQIIGNLNLLFAQIISWNKGNFQIKPSKLFLWPVTNYKLDSCTTQLLEQNQFRTNENSHIWWYPKQSKRMKCDYVGELGKGAIIGACYNLQRQKNEGWLGIHLNFLLSFRKVFHIIISYVFSKKKFPLTP